MNTRLEINQPFSVYGLINAKADTHAVRVFEIQSEIRLVRPNPIDAAVTTTLLQTGETQMWQDSVIQLADGDYRHVYWATFTPTAGETYRLDVTRSDGATTSAVTTVPPFVTLDVLEPATNIVSEAKMPVLIRGEPPTLPRIDVAYTLVGFQVGATAPTLLPVTLNYAGRPTKHAEGWLLEIDLIDDFRTILELINEQEMEPLQILELRGMEVHVHVGDENWISPNGVFNADFLAEPGVFTNVENGFGFFGTGYIESTKFLPPFILLRRAGFD